MIIMKRLMLLLPLYLLATNVVAQKWTVESEKGTSSVKWHDGMADIVAHGGLTLWCNERMEGNTVIEYDARVVSDDQFRNPDGSVRVSDLNCFWMAERRGGFGAKFEKNYANTLYYFSLGGNSNTTTRMRRYNGDKRGVEQTDFRPAILKEFTDEHHLLKPNRWYHIKLEQLDGHARCYINGELMADYFDPHPLTNGYFGLRTTTSHVQMRGFSYTCHNTDADPITLRWIGGKGHGNVTFGVPFAKGELTKAWFRLTTDSGEELPYDTWTMARWADGSIKWQAFATRVPEGVSSCMIYKDRCKKPIEPTFGALPPIYITLNGRHYDMKKMEVESHGRVRRTLRLTFADNIVVRAYQYSGSNEIKLVHTLMVDSTLNHDGLKELSLHFKLPMHGAAYQRYVDFGSRHMDVQPLLARRPINLQWMDPGTQKVIKDIAQWDEFRLTQLSPYGYSIRKRATSQSPWIGTIEGMQHDGTVTVGDSMSRTSFRIDDFWQSYPSSIEVTQARTDTAIVTLSLYSPWGEPFTFEHYDTVAHGLESAYEDIQPGMSTALGIARTSTIYINPESESQLMCTPEYLHSKQAFGIWSLPTLHSQRDSLIEQALDGIMHFYRDEIRRNNWYGFFNYGDVMHAYDASRNEWRYDVGGYAWDNTELGTPAMLWYQFLRTGNPDIWTMAVAMTRHCSEVDSYHFGPFAGTGSRHNVSHWGCGAKEARVSEAFWNQFYYYLTADERTGDIMHEVAEADTLLYTLDPMRLAQPRGQYPCTAPARLRLGPDWLAYAGNWYFEYERTGNKKYLDKLMAGMTSIARLPHGFLTGPLALGYDPATGVITTEADTSLTATNHLMTIMGGFETVNQMKQDIAFPQFYDAWLDHAAKYHRMSRNSFRIPRLKAYAAWLNGDANMKQEAWNDLMRSIPLRNRTMIWTNDCATWTLDAIFLKEVLGNE